MEDKIKEETAESKNDDIFVRRKYTFLVQNNLGPAVINTLRIHFKISIAKGDEEIVIVQKKEE